MMVQGLIDNLPPYNRNVQYIVKGDQDITDIIREVMDAHQVFIQDYDLISRSFSGGTHAEVMQRIFDFCADNLPYEAESDHRQTTRSPGAILAIAKDGGSCDCKHYSGFIGGLLDALNRCSCYTFDWHYRFASYKAMDRTPEHVFVVVNTPGGEVWLDPAPLEQIGGYVSRYYDDRLIEPTYFRDKQPKSLAMGLERLSGLGKFVPAQYGVPSEDGQSTTWYGGGSGNPGLVLNEEPAPDIYYEPYDEPVIDAPVFQSPVPVEYTDPVYNMPTVEAPVSIAPGELYPDGGPVPQVITPTPDTPADPKANIWLWILVAAGAYILTRKIKR